MTAAKRRPRARLAASPRFQRRRRRRVWPWLVVVAAALAVGAIATHRVRLPQRLLAAVGLHLPAGGGTPGHHVRPPRSGPTSHAGTGQHHTGSAKPPAGPSRATGPGSENGSSPSGTGPSLSQANAPGAPAVLAFYRDIGSGNLSGAYALTTPDWQAQQSLSAFSQTYAGVTGATVTALSIQSGGNFSRTYNVTVTFTVNGTTQTQSGTVTVVDESGGQGTPDWHLQQPTFAPTAG
jgi:hypothetical protein